MIQAVDYWCNLFTERGIRRFRDSKMLRYAFELFHREDRIAEAAGRSPETFLQELDAAGVEKILLPAFKMGSPEGEMDQPEAEIAQLCRQFPKRIYGLAGINPKQRMESARTILCCTIMKRWSK